MSAPIYLIRVCVTKTTVEFHALDDNSTDIYKSNIIEHYSLPPRDIFAIDHLCLTNFASFYYKDYKTDDMEKKDSQPDVLNDELLESHHSTDNLKLPLKLN